MRSRVGCLCFKRRGGAAEILSVNEFWRATSRKTLSCKGGFSRCTQGLVAGAGRGLSFSLSHALPHKVRRRSCERGFSIPSLLSRVQKLNNSWRADIKAKVFSRRRKYIRQTNGVSDQRRTFAVAGADKGGAKRIAHGKPKAKVFSRQRKYVRQTNGFSDQRKKFSIVGASNYVKIPDESLNLIGY